MGDFFNQFVDDDISFVEEGKGAAEFGGFLDTGSYLFNASLSGSMYGGIPDNKITGIAGETTTGKTFFALGIIKPWLDENPEGAVFWFDSEASTTKKMMTDRGVDVSRVLLYEPTTVQEFRTKIVQIIDRYGETPEEDRKPMIMVLDSLGQLSTSKEVEDIAAGNEKRDMTRAQLIRGAFRVLTLRLAKVNVPLLFTNHVYTMVGSMIPTKEQSGGGGAQFSPTNIVFLSKSKYRESGNVVGATIKCRNVKNRIAKENTVVPVRLTYDKGLDRYYGLLEFGEKHGLFKKGARSWTIQGQEKTATEKTILKNPEQYFTPDIMEKLEVLCQKEFLYMQGDVVEQEDDEDE